MLVAPTRTPQWGNDEGKWLIECLALTESPRMTMSAHALVGIALVFRQNPDARPHAAIDQAVMASVRPKSDVLVECEPYA